jgi:lipopolysaccharide export system protein LptA
LRREGGAGHHRFVRARALFFAAALASACVAAAGALGAEPHAKVPPLDVSADHLDLDLEAKSATLTGHVKVSRQGLELTCGRLDVRYDQVPNVTWAKGAGGVVAEVRGVHAEAPAVELDAVKQTLELQGGVKITRGDGWITADHATVQLATGKISMHDVRGSMPLSSATPDAPPPPSR